MQLAIMRRHERAAVETRRAVEPLVPELSVVMPVFNEGPALVKVINEWMAVLQEAAVSFEFTVYDDGSGDSTRALLDRLARRYARLRVARHTNRGHGPTILRGYREACGIWVLQVDSDDEIPASMFRRIWDRREGH